jgi:hypothetical protein
MTHFRLLSNKFCLLMLQNASSLQSSSGASNRITFQSKGVRRRQYEYGIRTTYPPTHLPTYGSTVLLLDLGCFFSFLILYTVGRTPWTEDQPVARPLPIHRATQTHNKRTQTSMPKVGFEVTIPVLEWTKTH